MDILIDPYRYVPATPACAEATTHVEQAQSFGGAIVGDGLPQSGPAVTARASFLASLQSYVVENLDSKSDAPPGDTYDELLKLTILGGVGEIYGIESPPTNYGAFNVKTASANGRFNTTSNAAGKYGESPSHVAIDLTATYTAFGCFYMDLGDVGGELEIDFYNGATKLRTITAPTQAVDKAGSDHGAWISYANGNTPFNRVVMRVRQFYFDPGDYDYVGFDDITVGQVVTCTASATPTVHYGINTTATTAKTVAGPAKTARDAWVAAAGTTYVHDFEGQTVATAVTTLALTFPGSAVTANLYCYEHSTVDVSTTNVQAAGTTGAVANSGASARWNTTASGAKWFEWTDEININFSTGISKIGFYLTDLGNQNATLRITLRRANGSAVVYYMPKAAELSSPAGLLRFWGVVGEQEFVKVVVQVVYYDNLTADVYAVLPAWAAGNPIETVGIDDILIG